MGDGEKIHVWKDAWISSIQTSRILSPREEANEDVEVGVLIDPIGKEWNRELVAQLFLLLKWIES